MIRDLQPPERPPSVNSHGQDDGHVSGSAGLELNYHILANNCEVFGWYFAIEFDYCLTFCKCMRTRNLGHSHFVCLFSLSHVFVFVLQNN